MLDDGAGRTLLGTELGYQLVSRIRIVDIVVGKLLALQKGSGRNAGTVLAGDVEARCLMRIFTIAHLFLQNAANGPMRIMPRFSSSANQLEIAAS